MIGKSGNGNRGLETCMGVKTEPARIWPSGRNGECRCCGKMLKIRSDGLIPHHGKMVGSIWSPKTQTFREV